MHTVRYWEYEARPNDGPDLDRPVYASLAWVGIATLVAAAILLLVRGDLVDAGVLGLFIAVSVSTLVLRTRLPKFFALLFVLAAMINAAGFVWNFFENSVCIWYDEVAHFLTSAGLAMVYAFWLYYTWGRLNSTWRFLIVVVFATLVTGLLWEVFEWAVGIIGSTWDTWLDIVMDLLGGIAGAWLSLAAIRRCHPDCLHDGDGDDLGRQPGDQQVEGSAVSMAGATMSPDPEQAT